MSKRKHRRNGAYVRQPYVKRLLELTAAGKVPRVPGIVAEARVYHDSWCGIFQGKSCNCNPEISIVPNPAAN